MAIIELCVLRVTEMHFMTHACIHVLLNGRWCQNSVRKLSFLEFMRV